MRKKWILLLFVILIFSGKKEIRSNSEGGKIWILFQDRPYVQKGQLHPAQVTSFSPASIQRRNARAEIQFDISDFPPDPDYIQAIRTAGAKILVESRWLNAVSAICNRDCIQKISGYSYVREIRPVMMYRHPKERIEPVITSQDTLSPDALSYGQSKPQLVQLNVPGAHKKGFTGQGEIVAIFDSGFRKDHIAFKNLTVVAEHDFVFNDDNVTNGGSSDSHGTSTWSCVGGEAPGKLYGAAFRSSFLLANTEDVRSESTVEEDNWVAALEWADQHGASVINSSLGYPSFYTFEQLDGQTAISTRAANTASKKGIVVVNSIGNSGPGPSTLGPPSDANNMIAVGAINSSGIIADFSSRGPSADGRIKPEVVARGVGAFVATNFTDSSFGRANGTSFSSPLTAGCAAALLSAHPDWKPSQVREALMMTASQASQPDNIYGYGIVNLLSAIDFLPKNSIVLEHKELKDTANASQSYRMIARIRAQRGLNVQKLFLFFKKPGSAFQKVTFSPIAGKPDQFEALIPPQPHGTTIDYYLEASDTKNKRNRLPFGAPKTTFEFKIN